MVYEHKEHLYMLNGFTISFCLLYNFSYVLVHMLIACLGMCTENLNNFDIFYLH